MGFPEYTAYVVYLLAYLLGSIPTAVWVSKVFKLQDPTTGGSNNPGATNMLRLAGKKPALITFLGDFFKATVVMVIADYVGLTDANLLIVLLVCLLGHIYPLFNRFIGGKGVASFFGGMLVVDIIVGLIIAGCWLLMAKLVKISSLSAMVSITIAPMVAWLMGWSDASIMVFILICMLILWRHKANIERLFRREEK